MHPTLILAWALVVASAPSEPTPLVHSVCDISQEFTFYMDGRFHAQYLKDVGRDARNWGTLHRLDLSNANLLVLTGGDPHVPYADASVEHVLSFARSGGTVLLLADGAERTPPAEGLARRFGVSLTATKATAPLRSADPLVPASMEITFRGGTTLAPDPGSRPLVSDAAGLPVLVARRFDEGWFLVGSRGLFGHRPDASDPINADWITPLLVEFATTKAIDPDEPHRSTWAERTKELGPLVLEFHEGTERYADAIAREYLLVRPHLVAVTGVEPSEGMIKRLLVLPTGGGGFSSGERIAIGAWWGDYPERRYPMVELIAHEAGHSWVLPYAEPLWNEPIATWLGIRVGMRLEMQEARETLERQIAKGRRLDPDFSRIDPLGDDAPRDLVWGKSYHVFEELERRFGDDAMAKYFREKRARLEKGRADYTMDDCVAVWSHALETDLFPWFRSLAFDVSAERTDLWSE